MTIKVKRGFLTKRYFCGKCNVRIEKDDEVCHSCGTPLDALPKPPKPAKRKILISRPKRARPKPIEPEPVEEELAEEFEEELEGEAEGEPGEEFEGEAEEGQGEKFEEEAEEESGTGLEADEFEAGEVEGGPVEALEYEEDFGEPTEEGGVQPRPSFVLPNVKTALWIVVIFVHLWGLFSGNDLVLVSGALLLIIIELEFIRRKLRKR